MNNTNYYFDEINNFFELFNKNTGLYIRSSIIDNGIETTYNPFKRNFPNLIDIGIMGHCEHGAKKLCLLSGVQCYQNGPNIHQPNMELNDYKKIINEIKGKVFSVALGGRGDPNKHEKFGEILEYTRNNDIIPNYTTSGLDLTKKEIELTKEFCGACAVSYYRQYHTLDALNNLINSGIKTNIHYVLSGNNIKEAIEILTGKIILPKINSIIFLLHKPTGLGTNANIVKETSYKFEEFFKIIDSWNGEFKIGFDSCSIPIILNNTKNIKKDSIETCEGGRFSMYISSDMTATPCSFDTNKLYGINLNNYSIQDVWNSSKFENFRKKLFTSCPDCEDRSECYGGCPLNDLIVICNKKKRSN